MEAIPAFTLHLNRDKPLPRDRGAAVQSTHNWLPIPVVPDQLELASWGRFLWLSG